MSCVNRRHIITAVLLTTVLLSVGSVQAQTVNRAGFFAGLNFANQGGDMDTMGRQLAGELENLIGGRWSSSKGTNMGLGLGAFYTIQTSPTFGVQIEGQYIRRGTKLELTVVDGANSATIDTEFQLNYLEFPVLLRFSPNPNGTFRSVFLAGPVVGIKTGADLYMSAQGESESESISDGYATMTIGALASVGFSAQVGQTTCLTVQARYYQGLTNPLDSKTLDAKSSDFGVFAGLEFLIGK